MKSTTFVHEEHLTYEEISSRKKTISKLRQNALNLLDHGDLEGAGVCFANIIMNRILIDCAKHTTIKKQLSILRKDKSGLCLICRKPLKNCEC